MTAPKHGTPAPVVFAGAMGGASLTAAHAIDVADALLAERRKRMGAGTSEPQRFIVTDTDGAFSGVLYGIEDAQQILSDWDANDPAGGRHRIYRLVPVTPEADR